MNVVKHRNCFYSSDDHLHGRSPAPSGPSAESLGSALPCAAPGRIAVGDVHAASGRQSARALHRAAACLPRAPDRPPAALGRGRARSHAGRQARRRRAVAAPELRAGAAAGARPSRRPCSTSACPPSGRWRSCPTTTSSICCSASGAMLAGVPFAPVSSAYSTVSQDFGKLRHIVSVLTPGPGVRIVGAGFARAIAATVAPDVPVVLTQGSIAGRRCLAFDELLGQGAHRGRGCRARRGRPGHDRQVPVHLGLDQATQGGDHHAAHAVREPAADPAVLPRTRRRAAGARGLAGLEPHLRRQPQRRPGAQQRRHALHRRRPADARADRRRRCATCARSRRRCTSTCPRASRRSRARCRPTRPCGATLFSRVKMFFFAGAGITQPVWDQLDALAEATCGERIRMLTGLGMTETAPFAICANAVRRQGRSCRPAGARAWNSSSCRSPARPRCATAARTSRRATGARPSRPPRASTTRASTAAATR